MVKQIEPVRVSEHDAIEACTQVLGFILSHLVLLDPYAKIEGRKPTLLQTLKADTESSELPDDSKKLIYGIIQGAELSLKAAVEGYNKTHEA